MLVTNVPKYSSSKPAVHLGDIVRRLRMAHRLSVRRLADKSGFSPSFISQVELRQASPSIASIERIGVALGMTLGEFFGAVDPPPPAIIGSHPQSVGRRSERVQRLSRAVGAVSVKWHPLIITLQPGGASGGKHDARQAEQLAVILKGSLELTLEREIHNLKRGDVAGIAAGTRHSWRNRSKRPAQFLLVTACGT
jgi:XRE family transcriptional regulator, regulator of sulfur utilization